MSSEYPDVLGDLVEAQQRFEVNGVHYVMALEPAEIAPGETTTLRIWLQSCRDVPGQVIVTLHLPVQPTPVLSVLQKRTEVPLEPAEVGEVLIPITCAVNAPSQVYKVTVTLGVEFETRGLYVRSQKMERQSKEPLLSFTTGTALATTMGLGFVAYTQPEQTLTLRVEGAARGGREPEPVDRTPAFLSHWTVDDLPLQGKARQHVNDQRLYLLPQLTREALFKTFLEESQERLRRAALAPEIGEAIHLAKILTYTVEYFLKHPDRQDALLIPAYMLAYRYDLPTSDPVFLVAQVDYARLARLAISMSFGLLRRRLKREVWTLEEQIAVADLVTDRVERRGALPVEFLYLPLLLGGLMVAREVTLPGEKPAQSLALLAKAKQKRSSDLAENPELVALFDRLLEMAQTTS